MPCSDQKAGDVLYGLLRRGQSDARQTPPSEGLQGRDIDDLRLIAQAVLQTVTDQPVNNGKKGSEGFSRTRRCRYQDVALGLDRRPGPFLGGCCGIEGSAEPLSHSRMKRR